MSILSIQSHVSYGYVGNKAATFPLQSLGYDVWAVNTVQFSNHSGYESWKGRIFEAAHIQDVIEGLKKLGLMTQCEAILSGYLGDASIGEVIVETVKEFKASNPRLVYLCDPVMGDVETGFFVREGILDFFKLKGVPLATIITPNHFEAEALWGQKIVTLGDAALACQHFHAQGVEVSLITSLTTEDIPSDKIGVLLSTTEGQWLAKTPRFNFDFSLSGTGDLFSSLYLGNYLKLKNPVKALENALQSAHCVIGETHRTQQRELKILGNYY